MSPEPFQKVILARVFDTRVMKPHQIRTEFKNPLLPPRMHADTPIFFGAGPIKGAPAWHGKLFRAMQTVLPRFFLVLPVRVSIEDPLVRHHVVVNEHSHFARQLEFERYYMEYAAHAAESHPGGGALLFNLCSEDAENPRSDGNPYAMDTRRELGEWYTHLRYRPSARVLVAADSAFPGLSQIERCFKESCPDFAFLPDLDALARAAASCAKLTEAA